MHILRLVRRRRSTRALALAAMMTVLAAGVSACGSGYNVATIIPLSGPSASYGQEQENAVSLALRNVRADHLLRGHINNHYYDSQALPAPAVQAAEQGVAIHQVLAMEVGFTSPVTAVEPLAARDKVLEINIGASGANLYGLSPYLLSTVPLGNQQIAYFAPFAVKHEHLNRWVDVYTSEPLGQGLKNAIDVDVPKAGGTVVKTISLNPTETNYSSAVTQIKHAVGTDAKHTMVYLAVSGQVSGNMQQIINALVAQGVHVTYGGFAASVTPALQSDTNAVGTYQFTNPSADLKRSDRLTKQFLRTFKATYPHTTLDATFVGYYNSTLLLAEGIRRLERTHQHVDGTNLIRALHAMGNIPVVGGSWRVSEKGTVNVPMNIQVLTKKGSRRID